MVESLFRDPLIQEKNASGRIIAGPRATVRLPRVFGFCGGVTRAVGILHRELQRNRQRAIWLLGPIIHNDVVNHWFRARGVRILPEEELEPCFEHAKPTDCFVIPAFGIPLPLHRRLQDFVADEGRIVDTTCRYVERIWRFAEEQAQAGKTIIIHSTPGHPETSGILSRALAPQNAVVLVPDLAHAKLFACVVDGTAAEEYPTSLIHHAKRLDVSSLACVNQTTMLHSETREIERILRDALKHRQGALNASNTVCRATQDRQEAARALCATQCDCYVVVGGYNSSNTNRLYTLARDAGPTFFIRDASAIHENAIQHFDPGRKREVITHQWRPCENPAIGVLAGASCPDGTVGRVVRALAGLPPNGTTPAPQP